MTLDPASNEYVMYGAGTLPSGIRSRSLCNGNGLMMHILEAGFDGGARPCILLLHGFPELAYSWRKILLPLAEAGFHVVAPDLRGYGRTSGWDGRYEGDGRSFHFLNLVRDVVGLVSALGYRSIAAVVGHDFGSPLAAWCALTRPDLFRSVALMSAPFAGPPAFPFDSAGRTAPEAVSPVTSLDDDLARLPHPRKHYTHYYGTPDADSNMRYAPQGLRAFLRAYYHVKSADSTENTPHPLQSWDATEMAKLPFYYVMERDKGMAETVAPAMPSAAEVAACRWLTDAELAVYVEEYQRNGFQGGLQWYRFAKGPDSIAELRLYSRCTIDVPSCFIAGAQDWGLYQSPGNFEKMQTAICTQMADVHLVEGAGHWLQQEQPETTVRLLLDFVQRAMRS